MAQNGPITIKKHAGTNLVLAPQLKDGLLALYVDRAAAAGVQTELTLGMRKPSASQSNKVSLKATFPYTVGSTVPVIERATLFIDVVIPPTCPQSVRDELVACSNSLMLDAIVADLVKHQGFPY